MPGASEESIPSGSREVTSLSEAKAPVRLWRCIEHTAGYDPVEACEGSEPPFQYIGTGARRGAPGTRR